MLALLFLLQVSLGSVTVVDGDTLHDNGRNRDYRLHGVDTPETARALCLAEKALGEAAAARVGELLAAAREVRALPGWDPRGRDRWPRDGFGRRIAVIELDGVSLGDTLLAEGLARPYSGNGARPDWCAADSGAPAH
jgi:micrococcal nuclease